MLPKCRFDDRQRHAADPVQAYDDLMVDDPLMWFVRDVARRPLVAR